MYVFRSHWGWDFPSIFFSQRVRKGVDFVCWFCILLFSFKCFAGPRVFWWVLWGLLSRGPHHLDRNSLILPDLFDSVLFLSLVLLLWLGFQALYWVSIEWVGTLTSLQFLKKILKISPFSIILTTDLPHIAFIKLRYVPSTFSFFRVYLFFVFFFRVFLVEGYWILLKTVSSSIDMALGFLSWHLFLWWIIYFDLYVLNQPCVPGGDANLVTAYDLNVFLIQLEKKCYWHLNLCLPWKLVCSFLFCSVLVHFIMGIILVLQNGGVFLSILANSLRTAGSRSPLKV